MTDPKPGAERPTPETDALAERGMLFAGGWYKKSGEYVVADFARTLERELMAARQEIAELRERVIEECAKVAHDHMGECLLRGNPEKARTAATIEDAIRALKGA